MATNIILRKFKKASHRLGENTYKSHFLQRTYIQIYKGLLKLDNKKVLKIGKKPTLHFHYNGYTNTHTKSHIYTHIYICVYMYIDICIHICILTIPSKVLTGR